MDGFNYDVNHLTEEEYKSLHNLWIKKTNNAAYKPRDVFVKEFKEQINIQKAKDRIFCSTMNPENSFMWKEYADNLRGVCFGFYFPEDFASDEITFVTRKVLYGNKVQFPMFNIQNQKSLPIAIYNLIFRKDKNFSKEEEVRTLLIGLSKRQLNRHIWYNNYPFYINNIKSVCYGAKISHREYQRIEKLITSNNLTIERYQMGADYKRRKI